jgi:segregation and condensation protein A
MAHHVILPIFEGPLDLLLFLINRAQLDIKEIFVSNITEQYLEYTSQMAMSNMENNSAFLIMAARLLEIKSQKLLPKLVYQDENEEDAEAKLIRQLQEYKLYKLACEKLKENEEQAKLRCYRTPEEIGERTQLDLKDVDVNILQSAFLELLANIDEIVTISSTREIERETFTVQEKIFHIRQKLLHSKKTKFFELFENTASKTEVIVTFLALLELSKLGKVIVKQESNREEIYICTKDTENTEE